MLVPGILKFIATILDDFLDFLTSPGSVQPENIILHLIRGAASQEAQSSLEQLSECYLVESYAKMFLDIPDVVGRE